jgi:hypothetical protein
VTTSITVTEAACAALLCLYAISTSPTADTSLRGSGERHGAKLARADAASRSAQMACENEQAGARDICFKRAKAAYIGDIVDASARANAGR